MYRNALDPYGLSYEPNLGWDSPEVTSTANALFAAQPSRFPRWELNALAGGEKAKAGLFGKALGALGLDESGNRAATSWTDAAKHTAGNVINAPQDIANQLLALREYQPVYGTAGDAEDKALAGRQAGEVFGLAGLAPIAGAGLTRATGGKGTVAYSNSDRASLPGITAYHGSPHDFERFSMDKIGTGEGAQAYGHGLYFAENEGVAKQYREALTGNHSGDKFNPTVGGKPIDGDAAVRARTIINMGGPEKFIERMQPALERARTNVEKANPIDEGLGISERDLAQMELTAIENKIREAQGYIGQGLKLSPPGHMYEVRINAAPEDFLDWDKPLSQQSANVRNALAKFDRDMYHPDGPDFDPMEPGQTSYQRVAERLSKPIATDADSGWTSVVNTINDKVQNRGSATDFLRDAGIPGIRYLDQGSRGAGEGSRNLVVFDDKIIDIIRKYGWAAAAPLIAAYQSDGAQANALAGR